MIKFWEYFIKLLHKLKVIQYFNFCVWVKFYDRDVKIPIIGEMGVFNLVMDEFWISDIYKLVHHDYKTCVDFGANLGQTLIKLKAVDSSCRYIGIEPNFNCVYYLNELILQNKYKDTTIIPTAIGERNALQTLYFLWNEKADRSATYYPNQSDRIVNTQVIHSITYDQLRSYITEGGLFIKIDIEKSEHVLIKYVLKNSKNIILLEVLPGDHGEDLRRIQLCNASIKENHFEIYRIIKHNENLAGFVKLDQIPTVGKIEESDFMLLHKTEANKLKNVLSL